MEENKNIETTSEAVDKADFADVNYEEEKVEEKTAKEKGKGIKTWVYGIIIAVLALIVILMAAAIKFAGKQETGLANRYGMVIGVPDGDVLYHSDYYSEKIYKTGLSEKKYGENEVVAEAAPWSFTKHNGDIYYFDRTDNGVYRIDKDGTVLVCQAMGYYHQFAGKYIYYMEPSTSYGGFVKRIPLTGGEAETVLNVNTSCFAIAEKNIVYYDPAINSLLITTVENGIKSAKAAEGAATTSAELKAVVIAERYAHSINVTGKDVYFVDASKENVLCHADLKSGKVEEINFGTKGSLLNVFGDYIFYVGEDNALYRMNLDGKDIRNLTGKSFKEFAGFGLFDDCIVAYALLPQLNPDTMQTEYLPVIAVMDFEGKPSLVIPAKESVIGGIDTYAEIPETEIPEGEEAPVESVG